MNYASLRTWLVRPLSVLLLIVLLIAALLALLAFSNLGTHLIASNVQRFLPGLELEEVQGALVRGVNLKRLMWQDETASVEVQQLKMDNELDVSFPATLHVNTLDADKLVIRLKENAPASNEPFDLNAIQLPLTINAKQVNVKEIEIWPKQNQPPIHLHDVKLTGKANYGRLQLDNIQAQIGALEVPLEQQTLQMRDLQLAGNLQGDQLKIDQLTGQVFDNNGKANFSVAGTTALKEPYPLNLKLLVNSASSTWGTGKASIGLGGELKNYTLEAQGDWQYANYPRYQADLKGKGTWENLTIASLALKGPAGDAQTKGQVSWQDGLVWQADVAGQGLNPSPFVKDFPAKVDAKFQTTGQLKQGVPVVALDISQLKGQLRGYPVDAKGKLQWNGQTKALLVNELDALVGKNRLLAKGQATDQLQVEWQVDAPDLNQLHPKLKGNVKGNGTLHGLVDSSQLQLEVAALNGKIEGYDLNAKGKVNWGNNKLIAQEVVVKSGANQLAVTGQATEPFDLSWKVDAADLAKAWKGLGGSLKGEGTLKGSLQKPELVADLSGNQLRYQDYRVGALTVKAKQINDGYNLVGTLRDVSTNGVNIGKIEATGTQQTNGHFEIDSTLTTIKTSDQTLKTASIKGQGTLADHQLTASATHTDGQIELSAKGGLQNQQWRGTVQNLSLRDTPAGNWRLTDPINLSVAANEFSSSMLCLVNQQGAQACIKPAWSAQTGVNATGNLQRVPLVMLRPWLPENINPAGIANADYRLEQRAGKPVGQLTLRLPNSSLSLRDTNGKIETLNYANASADLALNDRQLDVQGQFDLVNYGQVRADGRLDLSPNDGNHRINARITAAMPDISWAQRFSTQIDQLKGSVNGNLLINGLLKNPSVTGEAKLVNGQVLLVETGALLNGINLTMQANGADRALINGSLRAGPGQMTANGTLWLSDLPNWRAEVGLQGNNLKLMDTHEVQAWVTPNLQINASPTKIAITGNVVVPEGIITLRELPQGTNGLSEDVVIVGRQTKARTPVLTNAQDSKLDIQPNVTIELGDKIKFSGFGLDARLTGKLQILRTRQDIVAEGVLNVVDGAYKAYGQNLTIEKGRLVFNGPIDNPGLDIRAIRTVEEGDIKVGISLAGTVKQPESTLFSTPQQTQSDTLSYLLTGRAMSTLSGDQSSLLMDAITQLGIAGGESLAQQLGGRLGIDEVGLKAKNGDIQQSELSLGKRLGPRLYVRYIVSLFDSLQRLAITYQINKRLQLEAKTGLNQSVDLIYKIDTNKGPLGP